MSQDGDIGAFTPEGAAEVMRAVRLLQRSGLLEHGTQPRQQTPYAHTPIYFLNEDGDEAPPYACMQVTGTAEIGGQNYLTVEKPIDTSAEAGAYIFNRHEAVGAGKRGVADAGIVVRAIGGTAEAGKRHSPVVGTWEVEEQGGGLLVMAGPDDIGENINKLFVYPSFSAAHMIEMPENGFPEAGTIGEDPDTKGACGVYVECYVMEKVGDCLQRKTTTDENGEEVDETIIVWHFGPEVPPKDELPFKYGQVKFIGCVGEYVIDSVYCG